MEILKRGDRVKTSAGHGFIKTIRNNHRVNHGSVTYGVQLDGGDALVDFRSSEVEKVERN